MRGSITCFTFSPIHLGGLSKMRSRLGKIKSTVTSRELRNRFAPFTAVLMAPGVVFTWKLSPYSVSLMPTVGTI